MSWPSFSGNDAPGLAQQDNTVISNRNLSPAKEQVCMEHSSPTDGRRINQSACHLSYNIILLDAASGLVSQRRYQEPPPSPGVGKHVELVA